MTPETKRWAWLAAAGAAGLAAGAIVFWPKKAAAVGTPIAFLPSKAQPKSVSLTEPVLLHEGDNGAFSLRPTADFLWIKVPPEILAKIDNDVLFFTGDFQALWEKRENGQVYLMIPPTTNLGSRGSITLSLASQGKIIWQALVTLVAA